MGSSLGDLVKNVLTLGAYGQQEAQKKAQDAQTQAELQARRIAAEKKPMEETATLLTPATQDNPLSTLGLVVAPDATKRKIPSTGLGTSMSATGLGFGA